MTEKGHGYDGKGVGVAEEGGAGEARRGFGTVLGEIPVASTGMTDLLLRGCDGGDVGGGGMASAGVAEIRSVGGVSGCCGRALG